MQELIVEEYPSFNMLKVKKFTNIDNSAIPSQISNLPFPTILHQIPSEFVEVNFKGIITLIYNFNFKVDLLIDTENIPVELRQYFLLYYELMFQSPAYIDNKRVSFEEVSKLNIKDLLRNNTSIGIGGYYDRFISLRLKVIIFFI